MSRVVKCVVVDDEPLAIELLKAHISQVPQLSLVSTANSPIEALRILKEEKVDLLFLDIQMPVLTGIELVKTLSQPPGVIFTTAYRDYAVESYELSVIDYLVKPITFIRFLKAVNKYLGNEQADKKDHLSTKANEQSVVDSMFVNVNKKYVKIVFEDILYVESVKDYVHIHTVSDKVVTKDKISEFALKLPDGFTRVHRSFIVNRSKVTAFTVQDVEIGEKEIPIGQSYKKEVLEKLK